MATVVQRAAGLRKSSVVRETRWPGSLYSLLPGTAHQQRAMWSKMTYGFNKRTSPPQADVATAVG